MDMAKFKLEYNEREKLWQIFDNGILRAEFFDEWMAHEWMENHSPIFF